MIVNAALQSISQSLSAGTLRKQRNIPGLIAAKLRDFEENGLPQIPPGVDQNLMASLGVDDNYRILDFMTTVSFICLLNARLDVFIHVLHSVESTNMQFDFAFPTDQKSLDN